MNLIIIPHSVTLTEAIEQHILSKIEKLDHLDRRIIDARVTLEHDHTRVPEKQFGCSIRVGVRGPDLFAEARESNLYVAIDVVIKKIGQQFRKVRSKRKATKHKVASRLKDARSQRDSESEE